MAGRPLHSRPLSPRGRKRGPAGVTLVEVVLALGITSLIASSVAGLIYSVSQSQRDQQDLRRRNTRADVVTSRIDGAIRSSTAVLAIGSDYLVLWKTDSRPNQKPNLSEIQRIEWDRAGRRLRAYAAPADLTDAEDAEYDPASDFSQITTALKDTPVFPGQTWCQDVTGWQPGPAGSSQGTRLLCYAISFEDAAGTATVKSAAALRGQ